MSDETNSDNTQPDQAGLLAALEQVRNLEKLFDAWAAEKAKEN